MYLICVWLGVDLVAITEDQNNGGWKNSGRLAVLDCNAIQDIRNLGSFYIMFLLCKVSIGMVNYWSKEAAEASTI